MAEGEWQKGSGKMEIVKGRKQKGGCSRGVVKGSCKRKAAKGGSKRGEVRKEQVNGRE